MAVGKSEVELCGVVGRMTVIVMLAYAMRLVWAEMLWTKVVRLSTGCKSMGLWG